MFSIYVIEALKLVDSTTCDTFTRTFQEPRPAYHKEGTCAAWTQKDSRSTKWSAPALMRTVL
jgi:hypothetical protein